MLKVNVIIGSQMSNFYAPVTIVSGGGALCFAHIYLSVRLSVRPSRFKKNMR